MSLSDAKYVYNITISLFPYLEAYQLFCLNSMPVDDVDKDVSVYQSAYICSPASSCIHIWYNNTSLFHQHLLSDIKYMYYIFLWFYI